VGFVGPEGRNYLLPDGAPVGPVTLAMTPPSHRQEGSSPRPSASGTSHHDDCIGAGSFCLAFAAFSGDIRLTVTGGGELTFIAISLASALRLAIASGSAFGLAA